MVLLGCIVLLEALTILAQRSAIQDMRGKFRELEVQVIHQGSRQCQIQEQLNRRSYAVREVWAIAHKLPIRNGHN
jgi:predicted Holliday junction resolvase-like endonuclease